MWPRAVSLQCRGNVDPAKSVTVNATSTSETNLNTEIITGSYKTEQDNELSVNPDNYEHGESTAPKISQRSE